LIELILVMAMLTIVLGLAAPTLSRFFRGRTIDAEAVRFVALTRYAQSQAAGEGVPMVLWVNRIEGTYGLRKEYGYSLYSTNLLLTSPRGQETDRYNEDRPLQYQLARDLRFELASNEPLTNGLAIIRFSPDGGIDETSPRYLGILNQDNELVPIAQARNRMRYEISFNTNLWDNAYWIDAQP